MNEVILLRYGELFLKGKNRGQFEARVLENARRAIAGLPGAKVRRARLRALVEVAPGETDRALDRLARVFGLTSLSPARVVAPALAAIEDEAVRAAQAAIDRRGGRPSFKVSARRADKKFPLTSPELDHTVGARIVRELGLPVDVHKPDFTIGIEVHEERVLVFCDTRPGPGGLPVGCTGTVNLLLSGGIDSPVAGWLAMKRGCRVIATYFHSFPYTGDATREKVTDLARSLARWQGELTLFVVGFTDAQKALRAADKGPMAVVLYRRAMMRAAAAIARREHAQALVTGENLAQVASQTLENLAVIEEAATLPVLRPLLTYDKLETVALAQRIGTFELSIQPYEDCCSLFVPSNPTTRARLDQVVAAERALDVDKMAEELAAAADRVVLRSGG
ncbi:MAG: tRNA 4-thiouridine(8) synthase ThiI [Myxococcales bacterium]|nr:tRNA 4-thiouridine(8) synthase ThiI [Myxococcales bacterium]